MNRRIGTLLIFLLLGAIVNVAVAWGLASFALIPGPTTLRETDAEEKALWLQSRPDGFFKSAGAVWITCATGMQRAWISGDMNVVSMQPSGGGVMSFRPLSVPQGEMAVIVTCGWPVTAMSGSGWAATSSGQRRSVSQGLWMWQGDMRPTGVPFYPTWPGFAINTLFYAAILWLLFTARLLLPHARRRSRIKRGLCPACAYPVGTSDLCTECGHKLNITSKIARQRMGLPPPATPALNAERET